MVKIIEGQNDSYHLDYSDEIRPLDEIMRQVSYVIANDREGKVRQALIDLGWTPPPDEHKMSAKGESRPKGETYL